ncbi:MAG: gliding motility protein GldM, partial [Sulfurovum sp.]
MAGGQLTPRQKMINMMYLVLTALLAMNVSKSVLDAFKLVEEGIANSNTVIDDKIKTIDNALTLKAKDSEEAKGLLEKTKLISAAGNDLVTYIEGLKTTLLSDEYA